MYYALTFLMGQAVNSFGAFSAANSWFELDSSCWQANKVSWRTIRRLRGKRSHAAAFTRNKLVSCLSVRRTSLQIKRVYQISFKPSYCPTIGHTWGAFFGGQYKHCSRNLPCCWITECCESIRPEMLKASNRGVPLASP